MFKNQMLSIWSKYVWNLNENWISKFKCSIIPKNVLLKLQTKDDLKVVLTKLNVNSIVVGEIDEEVRFGPVEVNKESDKS